MTLMAMILLSSSLYASESASCIEGYQKSSDRISKTFRTLGRIDNGSGIVYVASVLVLTSAGVATIPAVAALPLASFAASSHRRKLNEVIELVHDSHALVSESRAEIPALVAFQHELSQKSKVDLDLDVIANEIIRLDDSGELCNGSASRERTVQHGPRGHKRTVKNMRALRKDLLHYFKNI